MNAKERVLTTIRHEEPDRVPLFFNSIDARLIRQLGAGTMVDTWKHLGVDVFVLGRTAWCEGIPTGSGYLPDPPPPEESLGGSIYAGWNGIDEYGRVWKHGRYAGGAVATKEDLLRYSPELKLEKRYNLETIAFWKMNCSEYAHALFSHTGPLGLTVECFGLMEFCYALADNRALVQESVERKTEWFIETTKHAVGLGIDFVVMGDDLGFKGHGYVSPADFREFAYPYYRKIVDAISVPVFWHSEGYVRDYIPMAVAAGIRGIHGIEEAAGMNLAEIKREFGRDLVLLGNADGNHILCQPDLALVRKEVDRCMRDGKEGGGFLLSIAGSAHENVRLDALVEMCRYNRAVGTY
jgi:uroporphyrinogen decarboxylase